MDFLPILQNMNEDLYIGRATGNVKSSSIHAMHKVLRYILEYKLHDFIGIGFYFNKTFVSLISTFLLTIFYRLSYYYT